MSRLDKELSRLYVYASMLSDQDTRVSEPQGMQQEMQQLYANFAPRRRSSSPRCCASAATTIEAFLTSEPRLKPVRVLPARHRAPRRPHAERCRKRSSWPTPVRWRDRRRTSTPSSPTPTSRIRRITLGRRQDRQGRPGRLLGAAHLAEPRGSQGGDVRVLRRARRLRPHLRHDDELERAEVAVLRPRPEVRLEPRGRARRARTSRCRSTCA